MCGLHLVGFLLGFAALALASGDYAQFHGKYGGKCDKDGFYFQNEGNFVICSNNNAYVQPCAPGTRNSDYKSYSYGGRYNYRDFCDVNLVDHGYGVHHGYSHKGHGNTHGSYGDVSGYGAPHGNKGYSGHDGHGSTYGSQGHKAPHGNRGYGSHDSYGNNHNSYGNSHESYGNRDSYGNSHDSYGNSHNSYGNSHNSHGSSHDSYGNRDYHGSQGYSAPHGNKAHGHRDSSRKY